MDVSDKTIPCNLSNIKMKKNAISFEINFSSSSLAPFPKLHSVVKKQSNYRKNIGFASLGEGETQANSKTTARGKQRTLEEINQKLFEASQRRLKQKYSKNNELQFKINNVLQNRLNMSNYRAFTKMKLNFEMKLCDERRSRKILSIQRKAQHESIKLKIASQTVEMAKERIIKKNLAKSERFQNVMKLKNAQYIINMKVRALSHKSKQLKKLIDLCDLAAKQKQSDIPPQLTSEDRKTLISKNVAANSENEPSVSNSEKFECERKVPVEVAKQHHQQYKEEMGLCNKESLENQENANIEADQQFSSELLDNKTSKWFCVSDLNTEEKKLEFEITNQLCENNDNVTEQMKNITVEREKEERPVSLLTDSQCSKHIKDTILLEKTVSNEQKVSRKVKVVVKENMAQKESISIMYPTCSSNLNQHRATEEKLKPKPKSKSNVSQEPKKPWRY